MLVTSSFLTILAALRNITISYDLQAYIIPTDDGHHTEFLAKCHERRAFISGFTGSAGTAIVTADQALLWTDGRYYIQAKNQLPDFWTLMKDGQPGTPSQSKWLQENLSVGSKVGVDPTLYTKRQWDSMYQELATVGITLVGINENLVDKVWKERPSCGSNPVFNHGLEFSGKQASEKLTNVRKEMKTNGATVLVVTELDEIAWLLNLRGSDIPYSSTFFANVIITEKDFYFFINQTQITPDVKSTLEANIPEISIWSYDEITSQLKNILSTINQGKVWYSQNTNYALVKIITEDAAIPETRQVVKLTPISLMKAIKNPTEVSGYRNALIRDSAALCEFFSWLEIEMASGTELTELSAAEKLQSIRKTHEHYVDDSFATISAAGENAALPHYMPTEETNRKINSNDVYLLDSGGLYRDGTTDITRTVHLGTPTAHQKDCYTRVLKGHMALTNAIFPNLMVGSRLDSFARQFLWEAGLDYNHGTGHGVGSFLNVHEGPFGIGSGHSSTDPGLRENFFTSNEPGYYEDNAFGIRLENIVRVKNVSLEHNFQNRGYLGFEDVTFVPYDHKLIDFSLLTQDELDYLNGYQNKIREHVGNYMREKKINNEAYEWMMRATIPVNENGPIKTPEADSAATDIKSILVILLPSLAFSLVFSFRFH